ncbi:MAG TPA: hypothetical protein PKC28_07710 [Bdellovibrionales bacterium]|nr:hypothetical protein [Bdellovibrionales bacterium]
MKNSLMIAGIIAAMSLTACSQKHEDKKSSPKAAPEAVAEDNKVEPQQEEVTADSLLLKDLGNGSWMSQCLNKKETENYIKIAGYEFWAQEVGEYWQRTEISFAGGKMKTELVKYDTAHCYGNPTDKKSVVEDFTVQSTPEGDQATLTSYRLEKAERLNGVKGTDKFNYQQRAVWINEDRLTIRSKKDGETVDSYFIRDARAHWSRN